MPETLTTVFFRSILACAALCGVSAMSVEAWAQINPGAPPQQQGASGIPANPMCPRLEAQLASIGRSGGDPAKDEQIRRYQDAAIKQQGELDRVSLQAKRMGCDSSGFFSLFSGQSAQCGPVNNQIQQMRANLEQITTSLERLRSGGLGGADRENQRRSVLAALAQNNCGPQYANAARGPGNFLENLFGNNNNNNSNPVAPPGADLGAQSGTYRTVCVRTCDGFYFPISFATVPARFPDDEKTCKNLCPASELCVLAERVSLPSGIQSVLRLQGCRTDLVRRLENHRRQGFRRTAGRHHRHRREREENVARAVSKGGSRDRQEGRGTGRCDGSRPGGSRAGA